jgi:hypothetical protein
MDPISLGILTTIAGGLSVTAIVALARKSPQVMGWVKAYVIGKGLLVLGRPIAGKTSTVNYLRYGQLATARRPRMTTGIKESYPFSVGQKDDKLSMYIRMATDVPGDLGIVDQLEVLTRRKPAILLVFISLAPVTDRKNEYKDYQATQQLKLWEAEILWLHNFADGLKSEFLRNQEVRKKLKVLVFVVNKQDLVDSNTAISRRQEAEDTLRTVLEPALGKKFKQVEVRTCSLYDEVSVDELILHVFQTLHENKSF